MDLGARLAGRHVLITGASSGLGAHFARLCARHGARVTIAARRRERLSALLAELERDGAAAATALDLDVTEEESVADCFAALPAPLDVLVNNAGVSGPGAAADLAIETFDAVVATNLRGPWLTSTHAARAWRAAGREGTIVNIASILGIRVSGAVGPYCMSKAALIQMNAALALEWARFGIRVNALAPGYVETEINADFFATPAGEALVKRIPMRRLGRPEDLDAAFLLLASDAAPWMTGAVLPVDGGHLVSGL
ncbi:SDR family NAD(P)-dependent oxidoreductase [Salinarimonas ramus]|uniref:3-oxoacyl-ACP reductase n=1 Tax=Salinarimonas ramus TaxID=690164 RepID=A0A917Q5H1_9HYPH|nr:SDR family oxidoreductase [Salinarimonas ramus]GGK23938.1 3-oxoacyl-ACP reductase [Salinarimonas ramus]